MVDNLLKLLLEPLNFVDVNVITSKKNNDVSITRYMLFIILM